MPMTNLVGKTNKKTIPFTIAKERKRQTETTATTKAFGISLTKNVKDLYN